MYFKLQTKKSNVNRTGISIFQTPKTKKKEKTYQKDTIGKKLLDISLSSSFVKSISPHQKPDGIISNGKAPKIPSSKVNNSQSKESAYGQGEDIHR